MGPDTLQSCLLSHTMNHYQTTLESLNALHKEGRLKALKPKLTSKGILSEYKAIFTEYKKSGIIEHVSSHEIAKEVGGAHYLPHRLVVREDKQTTKIHTVFNASCKV